MSSASVRLSQTVLTLICHGVMCIATVMLLHVSVSSLRHTVLSKDNQTDSSVASK